MYQDLTKGNITKGLVLFVLPMMAGNVAVYVFVDPILHFLQIPAELYASMREYLMIIFAGLVATSLYNFFACLLRALGNSVVPLWFLGAAALLNIGLGLLVYFLLCCRELLPEKKHYRWNKRVLLELSDLSVLTCVQQSAMNFGILLIQRLVDSFGAVTMAAFAAAVKIDTFAYLPVQDFGNAFSTFTAQNYGAGQTKRLQEGLKKATVLSVTFSVIISVLVVCLPIR